MLHSKYGLEEFNEKRELYKKANQIQEYLENTFKVEKVEQVEGRNGIVYRLLFGFYGVGINLSKELIIARDIDWLCHYAYELVFERLIVDTKRKYINEEEI